jgi:hypothetical protein
VDPAEQFIFAAGEDKMLRIWSIDTTQQLLPSATASTPASGSIGARSSAVKSQMSRSPHTQWSESSLLATPFEHAIEAMQVVECRQGSSLRVTVAVGRELFEHLL